MTDIYNKAARDAAKYVWQGFSSVWPHLAVWLAADSVGEIADWVMRKKSTTEASPANKQNFLSRYNPLNLIKKLNPVSAVSFAARPFLNVKKAISWFLFEDLAHAMKDKSQAISDKLAPIAENFLTPLFEKGAKHIIDYFQDSGLMEIPKPPVTCPVTVCEAAAPSFETLKEVAKQATTTEQTGSWYSNIWKVVTSPMVDLRDLTGNAAKTASSQPLKAAFNEFTNTQPVVENTPTIIKQAAEVVTPRQIPEGYLGLTEKYAEPAGRYVADTLSAAYNGATKLVHTPSDLTHAVQTSVNVFADTLGIRPAYVYAAGAGVALLAGYGLYNGLHGWTNNNTATATANAQGGNALGNQVNLVVNVAATPAQSNHDTATATPQKLTAQ